MTQTTSTLRNPPAGASSRDESQAEAVLTAAQRLELQIERMTAWKHQLARQMDILRRDGIKLLERQKTLAQEREGLSQEREALAKQGEELGQQRDTLERRAAELEGRARELEAAAETVAAGQAKLNDLELRQAALEQREAAIATHEAAWMARELQVREMAEGLELQRRELIAEQRRLAETPPTVIADPEGPAREARLKEMIAGAEGQIAKLESELGQLREGEERLRAAAEAERAAAQEHAGDLETQVGALMAALTKARAAAAASESETAERTAKLSAEAGELQEQLNGAVRALEETRAAAADAVGRIDTEAAAREESLRQTIAELEQQIAGLGEQLASARATATEAAGRIDTEAPAREETLREKIAGLEAQIGGLFEQLTTARGAAAEAAAKVDAEGPAREAELRQRVEGLEGQLAGLAEQLTTAREAAEEIAASAMNREAELSAEIGSLQHELLEFRERAAGAEPAAEPVVVEDPHAAERQAAYQRHVEMLERRQGELTAALEEARGTLERVTGESLLTRNTLEYEVMTLRQELEAGRQAAARAETGSTREAGDLEKEAALAAQTLAWHRDRLLHRAKSVRVQRRQTREAGSAVKQQFRALGVQREELKNKKESLEQVKRFLEKQELVMARKLADHSAIRTVAAAGIFMLMILGGSVLGCFTFMSAAYRAETVITEKVPANVEPQAFLAQQADFIRSPEVTAAAWRVMHGAENHYTMQDVQEDFVNSLAKNLTVTADDATHVLTLRYSGNSAEGVATALNALVAAYVNPTLRESTEATHEVGLTAQVSVGASVPGKPYEDRRLTTALCIAASAIFLALVGVMTFRHLVSRQLRDIDSMAEGADLSEMDLDGAAASAG